MHSSPCWTAYDEIRFLVNVSYYGNGKRSGKVTKNMLISRRKEGRKMTIGKKSK